MAGFEWSGYRSNLLATFAANSKVIKFWDLNTYNLKNNEEPLILDHPA